MTVREDATTSPPADHAAELLAAIREALNIPLVSEQAERPEHTKRDLLLQTRASAVIAATGGKPSPESVAFLRGWIDQTPVAYATDQPATSDDGFEAFKERVLEANPIPAFIEFTV